MKRKPVFPMPLSELDTLPTKRLLGRLKRLRECEESLALSDRDVADESGCIEFKQSPEWILAYREVKQELAIREHVPRKSERIRSGAKAARMVKKQRTKKPIMQKPAETPPLSRKPSMNCCLTLSSDLECTWASMII